MKEKRMDFDRFIAIDWSGARKGGTICAAECYPGRSQPDLIKPDNWTRSDVFQWLKQEANETSSKTIIGMDFAFAFPYCDTDAYFPDHEDSPKGIEHLWTTVENICQGMPDFYGGPFYRDTEAPFREYLWYPGHKGSRYQPRLRLTEKVCKSNATAPTTCFKFMGANQVGSGSVAGMRFLNALKELRNTGKVAIWPLDNNQNAVLTIVEIFPRLFVCQGFKVEGKNEHETDALTSALAIRQLAREEAVWNKFENMDKCSRDYEGWIFGVI